MLSRRHQLANPRRGAGHALHADLRNDSHPESELAPQGGKPPHVAGASPAEAEIVTDHHLARAEIARQRFPHERVRLDGGESAGEWLDDGHLDPSLVEQLEASFQR